jgi:hypothetical protein
VLRNIDIYKELCFPSFPGSITGRDLLGYVGRGELVPGQWVLIDNMLECVNDRLIERMERDGTGGQDDLCDSLEEWLRV